MSLPAHVSPEEARKALALGAVALLARRRHPGLRPHPLPDLSGATPEVIVDALLGAILAVHGTDRADDDEARECASCSATIDLASRYGDPTQREWPNPVRWLLADVIDAEPARQKE